MRKIRFSAFAGDTDLRAERHARDVDTQVLAGLSTSGVVLTTLRQAADDDHRLFVLADAIADPDPEVHRVLMEKVFPRQAEIVATADPVALGMAREPETRNQGPPRNPWRAPDDSYGTSPRCRNVCKHPVCGRPSALRCTASDAAPCSTRDYGTPLRGRYPPGDS
ncbi:cysteine hydrolase family protein [Streptomyces sp. NPDC058316]|uniref:cysteine hydrolase family protein n=1 Tax=Streptomyces sp. NPDC058316 TaxID=3346442 RepID=UPI0036E3B9A3